MFAEDCIKMLKDEGIEVKYEQDVLEECVSQDENYNELDMTKEICCYNFVRCERLNTPERRTLKEFDNKLEAVKYFMNKLLAKKYLQAGSAVFADYLPKILGLQEDNLDLIKEILTRNHIPLQYFSYDKEKKEDSILLSKAGEDYVLSYIDQNCKEQFRTAEPLNRIRAYLLLINMCTKIKLYDNFVKKNNLQHIITGQDYKTILE